MLRLTFPKQPFRNRRVSDSPANALRRAQTLGITNIFLLRDLPSILHRRPRACTGRHEPVSVMFIHVSRPFFQKAYQSKLSHGNFPFVFHDPLFLPTRQPCSSLVPSMLHHLEPSATVLTIKIATLRILGIDRASASIRSASSSLRSLFAVPLSNGASCFT